MAAYVKIEAVAMPADAFGRCAVRVFAGVGSATTRADDTDVRDANHAREIVRGLCGDGITDGEPPDGAVHLWTITICVCKTRRGLASYRCGYRKCHGCPLQCVAEMMDIYKEVKRVLRSARKEAKRD